MNRTNFYICSNNTIVEIQSCFSHFCPSLEIHFFSNNEKTQSNNAWVMLSPEVKIRDISPDCRDGYIVLNAGMTITELENSISDHFKLHAEISPIIEKQHFTPDQDWFGQWRPKNPENVRLPERTNATYFKNVPFGC